jgi:dimethylamine monooxygenase subunit C
MSATQFSPSISSRPVYPGLASQGAAPALMVADAEGAMALIELAERDPAVLDAAHIVYVPEGAPHGARLARLGARRGYHEAPSLPAALPRLRATFAEARMGFQLYLAGTEGLIGQVAAEALAAGLPGEAIQSEHRGSIARRMHCVHCKGITENVATDPFVCAHCGLTLFVRDHYSRRLGAFQGVCVDAETPGIVPATEEIRP